jgi:hypothetical protein
MKMLIAYHGDAAVKEEYVQRVRAHREAEQLVQGYGYWKGGKGCAVGCTIHGSDHGKYETALGIPQKLARIEDGIFEGLPWERAKTWPEEFLQAITPGADLNLAADHFLHWLLVDDVDGVIRFAKTEEQKAVIAKVGAFYARQIAGESISAEKWYEVRDLAWRVRAAAADAAAFAAAAAAADAAAAAAYAAAAAAADAATAAATDRNKAVVKQADKLLELLRAAPMAEATR